MKKLMDFAELRQISNYDCGACALQAVLAYYGFDTNEQEIMRLTKTRKIGTSIKHIEMVLKKFGLKYKAKKMDIKQIKHNINKKIPTIIPLQAWKHNVKNWKREWYSGHYVIAIGYDKNNIFFEDPGCVARTYLTYKELLERWHDLDISKKQKNKLINYGISVYGKKPVFSSKKAVHLDFDAYKIKGKKLKIVPKKYKRII